MYTIYIYVYTCGYVRMYVPVCMVGGAATYSPRMFYLLYDWDMWYFLFWEISFFILVQKEAYGLDQITGDET